MPNSCLIHDQLKLGSRQCDQMSERKLAKLLSKSYTKLSHQFLISKGTIVKSAQKVAKYLGYFGEKKYCQNLSKIFQSGHTANRSKLKHSLR